MHLSRSVLAPNTSITIIAFRISSTVEPTGDGVNFRSNTEKKWQPERTIYDHRQYTRWTKHAVLLWVATIELWIEIMSRQSCTGESDKSVHWKRSHHFSTRNACWNLSSGVSLQRRILFDCIQISVWPPLILAWRETALLSFKYWLRASLSVSLLASSLRECALRVWIFWR